MQANVLTPARQSRNPSGIPTGRALGSGVLHRAPVQHVRTACDQQPSEVGCTCLEIPSLRCRVSANASPELQYRTLTADRLPNGHCSLATD